MELNHMVLKKFRSLFEVHGLEMTEQSNNIVRYESALLKVSLAHNPRENSNILWIESKHSNDSIEIDDQVLKEFFSSKLQLNNLPQEAFVNNVFLFFTSDGERILQGDTELLDKLETFDQVRSEIYTLKLLEAQNIAAAEKAWKDRNYPDVVKYLSKVKMANLPASLRQKYKIARKKAISNRKL